MAGTLKRFQDKDIDVLYAIVQDAAAAFVGRLKTLPEYRYPPLLMLLLLLVLGINDAAAWASVAGTSRAVTALLMCLAPLKWLTLTAAMWLVLGRSQDKAAAAGLGGFVFLTQVMNLPLLIAALLPPLGLLALVWQAWVLWVQASGLVRLSGHGAGKVAVGYGVFVLLYVVVTAALLGVFQGAGWLDPQALLQQMRQLQHAPKP